MLTCLIKRCPVDTDYSSYETLKKYSVVAQGWSGSGDVSFFHEESDIGLFVELICEQYEDFAHKSLNKLQRVFFTLSHAMPHDFFLATEGERIMGICELPEKFTYAYLPDFVDEYANCIYPVRWVDWKDFCPSISKMPNSQAAPMTNVNVDSKGIRLGAVRV